jgi:creatinine amidohydrolase
MMDTSLTSPEIQRAAPAVAVVAVGSIEQHSAHLPIDTDFLIAGHCGREVAAALGALLLPALPYSVCLEHLGFAGVVCLKPDTLGRIVADLAESVGAWGVRHLVILSCHGGNFILNPVAREWNMRDRVPRIISLDFYDDLSGTGENLHACEVETSLMLHLAPERVHLERAVDFTPTWARADLTMLGMKRIAPAGTWGFPTRATAEKGERWLAEGVRTCTRRITRLMEARP